MQKTRQSPIRSFQVSLSVALCGAIDQPWREVIRLRDKGIHAYDSLSPATLYRITTESVPSLRSAVAVFAAFLDRQPSRSSQP